MLLITSTLFIGVYLGLSAFRSSDVISVNFPDKGRKYLSNTIYYIEANTACDIKLTITDNTIKNITISSRNTTPVELSINARLHTPDVRVTTVWNDSNQTTTLLARVPNGRLHHSITFDIIDGPITTDEKFFSQCLNLNYPGLKKVKKAVKLKDFDAARAFYIEYLRSRKRPVWLFNWHDFDNKKVHIENYDTRYADRISNNVLTSCNIEYDFGNTINWSINPTEPYYKEWTWQLSRHPYWIELGKAYWATGDEKYAKAFVRQARSWIIENPKPDDLYNKDYSRWRTLEAGIRMRDAWIESFYRFLPSPHFDDETVLMFVKSIYEHGEHLMANHCEVGNNRFAMEMSGLYKVAVMFPEFRESPSWEKYAGQSLYEEAERQFYPDGAQKELAPGYHGVAQRSILSIYKLAIINKRPLPFGFITMMEKTYDYYLKIRMPDGSLPGINDSDFSYDSDSQLKQGLEYFPNRQDYAYFVRKNKKGDEPLFKSIWMPWAGWYVMRSGWDEDALYSFFEVGPLGEGHFHEDKLSFLLYGYGSSLLTEGGNYPYDTSDWRKYIISASAHNVTRIDGRDQNRRSLSKKDEIRLSFTPLGNRWISNEIFDFGEGWYSDGFGSNQDTTVTQYRALLFIKNKYWIMFDVFTPHDDAKHLYETIFHLDAPNAIVDKKGKSVTAVNPGKAVLQIVPLHNLDLSVDIINGQRTPDIQGWIHDYSNGINTYDTVPVATPIYKRYNTGTIVEPYLLVPLKANEKPIVKSVKSDDNGYIVCFYDGSTLNVSLTINNGIIKTLSYKLFESGKIQSISVL